MADNDVRKNRLRRQTLQDLGALALALALCAAMAVVNARSQSARKPFSKDAIVGLLRGDVPPKRVGVLARQRGIDFEITPEVESKLRQAGATDELIATLHQLAPTPKPAQIVVETSPEAQVYLDGLFKGQASPQGRLVIENPKPGAHTLRLSLSGKRDLVKQVTAMASETTEAKATLADLPGSIAIRSMPRAEVFLDFTSRGRIDTSGQLVLTDVTAGPHDLRVSASGKSEYQQIVVVVAGQQATVNGRLSDLPNRPAGSVPGEHVGGIYSVGGGVTGPIPTYKPEPAYSEEARKAQYQGTVVLWIVVGADGDVSDVRVLRPLGRGLDEKAVEAVRTWKFKPCTRNGTPVACQVSLQITFKLF